MIRMNIALTTRCQICYNNNQTSRPGLSASLFRKKLRVKKVDCIDDYQVYLEIIHSQVRASIALCSWMHARIPPPLPPAQRFRRRHLW
jgi:hypothetical protein